MRMADSVSSAQYSNNLMEDLFAQKSLTFNHSKSQFLVMGNKSLRRKITKQLEKNPLTLCGKGMVETKALKYLGDYLGHDLEDSVHQTVMRRIGVVKHTILEIRAVIEDHRAEHLGSAALAFDIWKLAIIPILCHNAETWVKIGNKTLKVLDDLFNGFCQKIFRVGVGCPKPNFNWVSGSYRFNNIILQKKLLFYTTWPIYLQSHSEDKFMIYKFQSHWKTNSTRKLKNI